MAFSTKLIDLLRSGYIRNSRAIQRELEHGADPNIVYPVFGVSAMHLACGQGDEATQLLLLYGGDPNIVSVEDVTPLHVAASWGDWKTVQLLLRCGADMNIRDQDGKTAYDLAVEGENVECAQILKCHNMMAVRKNLGYVDEGKTCHSDFSGRQVCFDVTSPNNPVLGIKQSKIASDGNHSCACQKHPQTVNHRYQDLQDTGLRNRSLSPESHKDYNSSTSIHDHHTCIHNSHAEVDCSPSFHSGHTYRMYTHEHSGELLCNICSPCYSDTSGQPCTRQQMLHESCWNPSFPESCAQTNGNTRSYCKGSCHSYSTTLPSCVKSSSSFHKNNTGYISSVINRDCLQVGAREHCYYGVNIGTTSTKHQDCHTTDFSVNLPACQNSKTSCVNVTSQHRHGEFSAFQNRRRQKESEYFNKQNLLAFESSSEPPEASVLSSLTGISGCEHEDPSGVNKLLERFNSAVTCDNASSEDKHSAPLSDYFSTELSSKSPTKTGQNNDSTYLVRQDSDSGITFTSGKLFPPLLYGSVQSSCFDGSTFSFSETKDNCGAKVENRLKKAKRKSILKSQESTTPLPKSHVRPQERVAEFILSVQKYMSSSDCIDGSLTEHISPLLTVSDKGTQFDKVHEEKGMYHANLNKIVERPSAVLNTSESSVDTFATCDEGYSDTTTNVKAVCEKVSKVGKAISTQGNTEATEKSKEFTPEQKYASPNIPSRWKPPISVLPDEDIMTSDDSFVRKTTGRIYRMKIKHKIDHTEASGSKEEQNNIFSRNNNLVSRNKTSPVSYQEVKQEDSLPQVYPLRKRLSSDSLFSSVSVKEFVYKDKEMNITFIERHIPSDYGSSIGRRSLESTISKRTIDSEATLIYDWRSLNEVLRTDNPEAKPQTINAFDNRCATVCDISCGDKNAASLQENNSDEQSPCENISSAAEDDDDCETDTPVVIPAHLENMTCQQISQELQKYGEIPGPVIPATRQAYLRRLTTLQSNPGLVILSKACPDYPNEMRQALNGQFDISGLAELELDMIDVFNIPKNGHCWREGTEKSSFTYLLLDPRITENLPLRSKNLTDLEVFKTFICSIFYIGKGKRSRPYCHLYEAVSKMNKVNVKRSAKVKQIIDIWHAGLGVVSLHCFQSVIPVEAYTREACMIQAIGVHKLTNMKQGDFYGAALSWTAAQRRKMGVYLLRKALQIFLAEGERQICLPDIKCIKS